MGKLKQIADEVGCSVSTVSRVLNNYKKSFSVNPELRERIMEATKKFDYKPNPYWRTLRSKKTQLIAVLCRPINDLSGSEAAKWSFIQTIRRAGYREIVQYIELGNEDEAPPPLPVDGALLFDLGNTPEKHEFAQGLVREETPTVIFNGDRSASNVSIMVDEKSQMELLLAHLFELGHRKIGYLSSSVPHPGEEHYSVSEREASYAEWMIGHGLEVHPGYDRPGQENQPFLTGLLGAECTAVICYSATRAMGMQRAAQRQGLVIPRDLSIVGINDTWPLALTNPPITCSAIPWEEMGRLAGQTLLDVLAGKLLPEGQSFRLAGELKVRESTACPRTQQQGAI